MSHACKNNMKDLNKFPIPLCSELRVDYIWSDTIMIQYNQVKYQDFVWTVIQTDTI